MKKNRKTPYTLIFLTALLVLATLPATWTDARGAKPALYDINRQAAHAKARNLVEAGGSMITENLFAATFLYAQADSLAPENIDVRLATNNLLLTLVPGDNEIFNEQLELLEQTPDAPAMYYYTLVHSWPEGADSLSQFNTAMIAYRRFPDNEMFIDNLLGSGVNYIYESRYRENADYSVDTLELAPDRVAFANNLLNLVDTIEQNNGYSSAIDRTRAALYSLLQMDDQLSIFARNLEQRDSTDVEILDLLTSLAYINNDTIRLSELGIRRFELAPEGEHIYSLYGAMPNDSLRSRLVDVVLLKASDTDIEPELRLSLLGALAQAYYKNNDEQPDSVVTLSRISDTVAEITAEDPAEIDAYIKGMFLVQNRHWLGNYGYRHWENAVDNITDSLVELQLMVAPIIGSVSNRPDFEKRLVNLLEYDRQNMPHLVLPAKLLLSQYYFNSDLYDKALQILKPITLDELRTATKLSAEYNKTHPDTVTDDAEFEDPEDDDSEAAELKRWITIQTLISECQMKLEQIDDALATLNSIIAIEPENAEALNNLAYYMCENGRDLTIALSLVERALAVNPDNLNAIDTRAWILFKKGDAQAALRDMTSFFEKIYINLEQLLDPQNTETAYDILSKSANLDNIPPILGHLLAIIADIETTDPVSMWRVADALQKIEPENEDLLIFLKNHPDRPENL